MLQDDGRKLLPSPKEIYIYDRANNISNQYFRSFVFKLHFEATLLTASKHQQDICFLVCLQSVCRETVIIYEEEE